MIRQKTNLFCWPHKKWRSDTLEPKQSQPHGAGERTVDGVRTADVAGSISVIASGDQDAFVKFTRKDVLNVHRRRTSANTANIFRVATRCRNTTKIRIPRQGNNLWDCRRPNYGTEGYRFEPCGVYSPKDRRKSSSRKLQLLAALLFAHNSKRLRRLHLSWRLMFFHHPNGCGAQN